MCAYACVCVCVCMYVLRIVSMEKKLHLTNTLFIIIRIFFFLSPTLSPFDTAYWSLAVVKIPLLCSCSSSYNDAYKDSL